MTHFQANQRKRKKTMHCKMCTVKNQLEIYECIIFDKRFVENSHEFAGALLHGSWKPSFQEYILKGKRRKKYQLIEHKFMPFL